MQKESEAKQIRIRITEGKVLTTLLMPLVFTKVFSLARRNKLEWRR